MNCVQRDEASLRSGSALDADMITTRLYTFGASLSPTASVHHLIFGCDFEAHHAIRGIKRPKRSES